MTQQPVPIPSTRYVSHFRLAGLSALGLLPSLVCGQVVYTATPSGTDEAARIWQAAAQWTIAPTGSPSGFPNDSAAAHYNVTISTKKTYNFIADVTVSSLTATAGLTMNDVASRTLTINGPFNSSGGALTSQNSLRWVFNGISTCNAAFDLRNGSSFINNGTMTFGSAAAAVQSADEFVLPASGYAMENTGTLILDRPGGVTFQNFHALNSGLLDIRQGEVHAEEFAQTSGVIRVKTGASLTANKLNFQGGTVIASGSTLQGSNFTFQNTSLFIGETGADVAHLTLKGNAASDAGQGATFNFLIASGTSYDTLTLENGMNFNGLTLRPFVLDGYAIKKSDVFTLITGNNLANGTFKNQNGTKLDVDGFGEFTIARSNGSVVLSNFTPIPEPEPFALAAGVALVGFGLWRRRGA